MGELAQSFPPYMINGEDTTGANSDKISRSSVLPKVPLLKKYKWWIQVAIYAFFILAGSAVGTILGRLYYAKGGNSKWISAIVQIAGFPILIPFFFLSKTESPSIKIHRKPLVLGSIYLFLGLCLAFDCLLYSIGLMYLPVTTYSMIASTTLGFNALFSYFLNGQKFTPYIINSLVLLTSSTTLLVFQNDSVEASGKTSRKEYLIGFMCTLAASAGLALIMSLTRLSFQKIIKEESVKAVMNLAFFQNLVATLALSIGLFASGEWKNLDKEMEGFEMGKVSYVMNLIWTAISWQVCSVGGVGLIFKVSSLFANVIGMVGVPIAPILAVIIFNDKITGLKVVAMLLAMWGFVSYVYHYYLDDLNTKGEEKHSRDTSMVERG